MKTSTPKQVSSGSLSKPLPYFRCLISEEMNRVLGRRHETAVPLPLGYKLVRYLHIWERTAKMHLACPQGFPRRLAVRVHAVLPPAQADFPKVQILPSAG